MRLGVTDRRSEARDPGPHAVAVRADPLRALVAQGEAVFDRLVEHLDAVWVEGVGPGDRHRSLVGAEPDAHDGMMPTAVVPGCRFRAEVVDIPVVDRRQPPTPQGAQCFLKTPTRTLD